MTGPEQSPHKNIFVPQGYVIQGDRLIDPQRRYGPLLINRSFKEINHTYRNLPSEVIEEYIRLRRPEPVRILDAGGGFKSQSALDLGRKFRSNVSVVNVDLALKLESKTHNVFPIPASIDALPFADNAFDFVYSRMVFANLYRMPRFNKPLNSYIHKVYSELIRVLKADGVGIIDDEFIAYKPVGDPDVKQFADTLGVSLITKQGGLTLTYANRLHKIVKPDGYKSYDKLVVIIKEGTPERVRGAIDRKPEKPGRWAVR
jgi:ubiquinone/menaquinone biosynthesis C-methylase UbiE